MVEDLLHYTSAMEEDEEINDISVEFQHKSFINNVRQKLKVGYWNDSTDYSSNKLWVGFKEVVDELNLTQAF